MIAPTPPPRTRLAVRRLDTPTSALITLIGEIDLDAVPMVRDALESRLHDGIRTIDVDLVALTFCDVTGIGALLGAAQHAFAAGVSLLLHEPTAATERLLTLTGTRFLLTGLTVEHLRPLYTVSTGPGPVAERPCPCCGAAPRAYVPSAPRPGTLHPDGRLR